MRRVYTDERFPGYEIVNNGSGTFEVYERGQPITTFESWENQDGTVSEPFAARRARDYFDRWARMDLSGEIAAQAEEPAEEVPAPQAEPGELTRTIDDLMAQQRLEQDPQRKAAIQQQIMQLMRREESVAAAVVNHLIAN